MRTSPPHGPCGVVTAYPSASLLGRISGSIGARHPEEPQQLLVPVQLLQVHEHGAAGVGDVGDVPAAVRAAGEVPHDPRVGSAEERVAALGRRAQPVDVLQQPLQLAAGEVGGRRQPGLAPDDLAAAVGVQGRGDAVGAGVLPDDGVVPRTAGMPVPDDRRLALVGDADGVQVAGAEAGAGKCGPDDGLGALPDLQRVVLDPPGAGEDLLVLELVAAHRLAGVVEDHEPRARRALVDGAHEVSHGLSLAQRAGVVLATVTRLASDCSLRAPARRRARHRSVLGRPRAVGEQQVHRAACFGEDRCRSVDLGVSAVAGELSGGAVQLLEQSV